MAGAFPWAEMLQMKIFLQRVSQIGAIRSRGTLFIFAILLIFSGTLSAWFQPNLIAPRLDKSSRTSRTLTFADRVRYQRAIEQVYWHHRIWPDENSGPKPALDQVMPATEIEK